jgi:hypothetical protein
VSLLGTAMSSVAIVFAVPGGGGTASGLGIVLTANIVPLIAFTLGRAIADRLGRRPAGAPTGWGADRLGRRPTGPPAAGRRPAAVRSIRAKDAHWCYLICSY